MFKKILIANRGEIAVRIIRACRDLGISPVVVYSEVDRDAMHVKLADEAYYIGEAPSSKSYLCMEKILTTARKSRAPAIHPGYGFLAENDQFAQACQDSGLVFIGPSPASIKLMGSKLASRTAVKNVGVPIVPGTLGPVGSVGEAVSEAERIGYPVMLKADAGGGGKGLRQVRCQQELRSAYETARSEADSSFSDSSVYIEKYLERPRHIEVQLLGDQQGNLISLGERECSIQRRHQKLVEECPSPAVDEAFRAELSKAALTVAEAANYYSLGTVEFLVNGDPRTGKCDYYFLEMNSRLQVEHAVTEMVTGIDLVSEQISIAHGEKLNYQPEDVQLKGWAVECRIYAEDPLNQFLPSPGKITSLFEPSGPGIRHDSGVYSNFTVPIHYDPLISKLIALGKHRGQAILRMRRALGEYKVAGIRTTIPFFESLLSHPEFLEGNLHTHFLEEHRFIESMEATGKDLDPVIPLVAAVLNQFFHSDDRNQPKSRLSSWKQSGRFPGYFSKW